MEPLKLPLWARYIAAGSMTLGSVGCLQGDGSDANAVQEEANPGEEPEGPLEFETRIAEGLGRLQALQVFEADTLINAQAGASGNPYLFQLEYQVARLESLASIAEQATKDIGVDDIANDSFQADGTANLCMDAGTETIHCLTRTLHDDNLALLNAFEIIAVDDIIRSTGVETGRCYSSWYEVSEDDCVRALKLEAIVNAAAAELL